MIILGNQWLYWNSGAGPEKVESCFKGFIGRNMGVREGESKVLGVREESRET